MIYQFIRMFANGIPRPIHPSDRAIEPSVILKRDRSLLNSVRSHPTPLLTPDEGLRLVPVEPAHLDGLVAVLKTEPDTVRTAMPWVESTNSLRRQLGEFLVDMQYHGQRGTLHAWLMIDPATSDTLGVIGLDDSTHAIGADWNLGYWVRRSARSRGIATKAMDAVASFAREVGALGLELKADPTNAAGLATIHSALRRWGGRRAEEGDRPYDVDGSPVIHHSHLLYLSGDDR